MAFSKNPYKSNYFTLFKLFFNAVESEREGEGEGERKRERELMSAL